MYTRTSAVEVSKRRDTQFLHYSTVYKPLPTRYSSNRGTQYLAQNLTYSGLVPEYALKFSGVSLEIKAELAEATYCLEVTKIRYPNNMGSLTADYEET